jgi:hypothetical protein
VARIVESVLIEDECVGECADFQKPVPVRGVARQSRDFQAEHDPSFFQTHFRHQLLKSFAIRSCRGGVTEVAVDDNDALHRPTQRYCALAKVILSYRAFCVLNDLTQRGLPYIQIRVSLQMAGVHLFVSGYGHNVASC